jgi:Predicted NTP pyrophosphohydrolase
MAELWDAYDINRKPLGHTLIRGDKIPDGEYHLVVCVFIVNSNGDILLTQRHPDKPFPLAWESTGGSVVAGENSLIGAMREVEEEIGLTLPLEKFTLVKTKIRKSDFLDTYLVIHDVDITSLKLQPTEVVDAKLVTFDEYITIVNEGPLAEYLIDFFEIYQNYIIKKAGKKHE